MVFFSAVFAARAPAMGNSADRAWQLSQLVEGVSTAFNPSHGSLSYVQAGHCVSKQIGRHDAACQGCPRCVFLARRKLAASGSSRAPCAFPNLRCYPRCWLFSCLGLYFHLQISPKSTKRSAAAISRSQRSFITFHGALQNILLSADLSAVSSRIPSDFALVNIAFEYFSS